MGRLWLWTAFPHLKLYLKVDSNFIFQKLEPLRFFKSNLFEEGLSFSSKINEELMISIGKIEIKLFELAGRVSKKKVWGWNWGIKE